MKNVEKKGNIKDEGREHGLVCCSCGNDKGHTSFNDGFMILYCSSLLQVCGD